MTATDAMGLGKGYVDDISGVVLVDNGEKDLGDMKRI